MSIRIVLLISCLCLTLPTASASWKQRLELNPFSLLSVQGDVSKIWATGTLAFSNDQAPVEIAIPLAYLQVGDYDVGCCEYRIARADVQLRRFLQDRGHTGHYVGGLARASRVWGRQETGLGNKVQYRFGLGVVLGTRVTWSQIWGTGGGNGWRDRLYGGFNVNVGYFLDKPDPVAGGPTSPLQMYPSDNHKKLFWNVEFLKVGYRF